MSNEPYAIHGTLVPELITQGDFVSALWFVWTGERPSADIRRLLDACLIACIDHGTEPPSAQATRKAATEGAPIAVAVAAGLSELSPRHGNAATPATRWIADALAHHQSAEDVIRTFTERGERIPGIGHRIYTEDPRTTELFLIARDVCVDTTALDLIIEVAHALSAQKGKPMPVNVDGALGAIIVALSADPRLADALFIAARTCGLLHHAMDA